MLQWTPLRSRIKPFALYYGCTGPTAASMTAMMVDLGLRGPLYLGRTYSEDCDAFGDRSTRRGATSKILAVVAPGSSLMSSHSEELVGNANLTEKANFKRTGVILVVLKVQLFRKEELGDAGTEVAILLIEEKANFKRTGVILVVLKVQLFRKEELGDAGTEVAILLIEGAATPWISPSMICY
ncbi:unnamed protein product [Boreogadus saida]